MSNRYGNTRAERVGMIPGEAKEMPVAEELSLDTLYLSAGVHATREDGVNVIEAAAWLAGEAHTADPASICPVIRIFAAQWNDSLDDVSRQKLKAYIPKMIGTAGDGCTERRGWLCLDWLSRECAPAFLSLTDVLQPHAARLRALPPIRTSNALPPAQSVLAAALTAARGAAAEAANAAVRTEELRRASIMATNLSLAALRAVAWAVADETAKQVAFQASVTAATGASKAAALALHRAAVGEAVTHALQPTVSALQVSAFGLLGRMCALRSDSPACQQ